MTISRVTAFYIAGGTLPPHAPSYIPRRADEELLKGLLTGEFCYVLTPRQMGKSSLMVRTAARLRDANVCVATLDLTAIGRNLSPDRWYYALLLELGDSLGTEMAEVVESEWSEIAAQAPLHGFLRTLRKLVHCAEGRQVIVFVDEVDYVRSLPFSVDEFFAAIRACYNERAADPSWNRLTFCLLGVATPTDLIRDPRVTPFNIGHPIRLEDFTLDEALPLASGLIGRTECIGDTRVEPEKAPGIVPTLQIQLLRRILHWTSGHPYLTQRLLHALAETRHTPGEQDVDAACWRLFLEPREREIDSNLLFVRETILQAGDDLPACLDIYGRVLAGQAVRDAESDRIAGILRLSGIVRVVEGYLRPRNAIYAQVFDRRWVVEQMPQAEQCRQRAAYRRGALRTAAIAAAIMSVMTALMFWNIRVARKAERAADVAKAATFRAASESIRANAETVDARRLLYYADMLQASQAWESGNMRRLNELLNETRGNENRAFEWDYWQRLAHLDIPFETVASNTAQNGDGHAPLIALDAPAESALAPDGSSIATRHGAMTIVHSATLHGKPYLVPSGLSEHIVALSKDGKWLATVGAQTQQVTVWNAQSGRRQSVTMLHNVRKVRFSPDGSEIAGIDNTGRLLLCESLSGRLLRALRPRVVANSVSSGSDVRGYCFSPDGSRNATTSDDGVIRIWTGTTITRTIHSSDQGGVGIAYSSDGRMIATCSEDQWLTVWSSSNGKLLHFARATDTLVSLSFSADGKRLATAGAGGTVRVWDVASMRSLFQLRGHEFGLTDVVFTQDWRYILSRDESGIVKLWPADGDHAIMEIPAHKGYALSALFTPNGSRIVTVGGDLVARVWDSWTGRMIHTLRGHTADLYAADVSPDGKWIATGAEDKTTRIWDAATGNPAHILQGHTGRVNTVRFSPNSSLIVTAGEDRTAILWDVSAARALRTLHYPNRIWSAAFSPDGMRVALGGMEGTVEVHRVTDGGLECTATDAGVVRSVAFSPDGDRIAGTTTGHTGAMWDSHSGKPVRQFVGNENVVSDICFSPDGRRFLTAGYDGTARLWDTGTGREVLRLRGNGAKLSSARFSPDGRRIVAAGMDGAVYIWSSR